MIDFCGYKFQVGAQSVHLYPISSGLWELNAVTVCEDLGQVLPGDPRLIGVTIEADPNSVDPDQIAPGVKCFVRQARDLKAIIQADVSDFKAFAVRFGGVAFEVRENKSWIIKGVARKMTQELKENP